MRGTDISHLQASGCWTNFCVLKSDTASTGYDNAALQGRVLLKLCEAEVGRCVATQSNVVATPHAQTSPITMQQSRGVKWVHRILVLPN